MHRPHPEIRTERGVYIVEDRYPSGLVEMGYYRSSKRGPALCFVERQPGTVKQHLFGPTGSRPVKSGRSKADIMRQAPELAAQQLTPATRGTLETTQ